MSPVRTTLGAAGLAALTAAGATTVAAQEGCDKPCLVAVLDGYLAAVTEGDPSAAALSGGFRETQNAVDTPAGEGLWTTVRAIGAGRRYADPVAGEVGFFGTVEEEAGPAITSVRLMVADGAVTEAEWIVAREGMAFYRPDAFAAYLPPDVARVEPGVDRDAAIAAANSYFEGIDEADGSLVMADPECFRTENGTQTVGRTPEQPEKTEETPAGDGVTTALASGVSSCSSSFANLANVTEDVIDRRFFYDAEAGVVWGHGTFKRVEGYRNSQGEVLPWLNFTEIFQIEGGKIRGIYAAMNYLPADITSSGWPGAEE